MNPDWLIIDGYNLLHKKTELAELVRRDIHLARNRLIRLIENTAIKIAPQTTVVFDGREAGQDEALTSKHLEIYYSPANLSADNIIERLVNKYPNPEKIRVVTSDIAERQTVSSAGAQTMFAEEFLAQCEIEERRKIPKQTKPGQKPKLGDLFPDGF